MEAGPDLLILVEDPGAANFALDLPAALASRGIRAALAATGPSRAFLSERGQAFLPVADSGSALDLLRRLRPRMAALGTADRPDAVNLALADCCRSLAIPTAGFVDGPGLVSLRFAGVAGPLAHAPDWILVPDEAVREAYIALGHPRDHVIACGHPALERAGAEARRLATLDRAALRARLFPEAPRGAAVLVFAAEISATPRPGQYRKDPEYTLHGSGRFAGRCEIVLEEVLDALENRAAAGQPRPHVVLRLHPKNTPEEFAPFLSRVDSLSRGGSALELIHASDAVVGMTSILLAEAVAMGRPTLAVVPRDAEEAWLWTIGARLTPVARTRDQVADRLQDLLAAAARPPAPPAGPVASGDGPLGCLVDFFEARLADQPRS